MELTIEREEFTDKHTIGKLWSGGVFLGYTMEDTVRAPGVKVQNETAIPEGRYRVRMTWSNRFKKVMPELMNVPMFAGVRIHGGNTEADTEGCVLLGSQRNADRIYNCAPALQVAYGLIADAERSGEVWMTIRSAKVTA